MEKKERKRFCWYFATLRKSLCETMDTYKACAVSKNINYQIKLALN